MFNCNSPYTGWEIREYTGDSKCVVIPKTYNGEIVKGIWTGAFKDNQNVETIDIQADLVTISAGAFENCCNLKSIKLPETLVTLADKLFYGCKSLKSVKLPKYIYKISSYMFYGCESLVELELPDNIKTIDRFAFSHCINLRKIKINEGVTSIEANAFAFCSSLEEITLPKSLKHLMDNVFDSCKNLKKIIFLNDPTWFNESIFNECDKLEYITISALKNLQFEMRFKVVTDLLTNNNPIYKKDCKELITNIETNQYLKKLIFTQENPEHLKILFDNNIKLSILDIEIYLESTIKNDYTQITAMLLDYKNKNFTEQELNEHKNTKELIEIGIEYPTQEFFEQSFDYCKVEGGIKVLGYLGNQTTVNIPKQLADGTKIVAFASSKDTDLLSLRLLMMPVVENETSFDTIKNLIIDADITIIDKFTFKGCRDLEKINIPDTVAEIGESAFEYCSSLTEIIVPNSINILADYVFSCCTNLISIELPENLTEIKKFAFQHCINLKTINIPAKVNSIETGAFLECTSLKNVILSKTTKFECDSFPSSVNIEYTN